MGEPPPFRPGEPPPPPGQQLHQGHPAVTSSEGGRQGVTRQMRTFAQILADEEMKRNIIEINS